MKSISFIATPVDTKDYGNYIEDVFEQDQSWQKRARKLRERRWRKLASKIAATEHNHFSSRHPSY